MTSPAGNTIKLAFKVDVDTERGTRIGVPQLMNAFNEFNMPATFLFSLGPDNTGRAIRRVFRPGFMKKVGRTSIVSTYGLRTLLNGVLWPGPHIAKRHASLIQRVPYSGDFEVGIHCYDHVYWQDRVHTLSIRQVYDEFAKACEAFEKIFHKQAKTAGAAGWQANANSLRAYDDVRLLYASDSRGKTPFFPQVADQRFKTLQIPTTLPTLDELMGRPEYPMGTLIETYLQQLSETELNVFTLHAEIEGMKLHAWFRDFLKTLRERHTIEIVRLDREAERLLANPQHLPVCLLEQGSVDGRSGTLAVQGSAVKNPFRDKRNATATLKSKKTNDQNALNRVIRHDYQDA